MTSEKYFLKWIKEAGRGHITGFLSWGSLTGYVLIKAVQLGLSTEYNYFGMGSTELLWICAGLGAALSLLEFFYLMQPRKLDFYYSLPVKKSTIFWGRYVHGLLHFIIPLCLAMAVCGLFESSLDPEFFPYSASYTGHSILAFTAVFLLFYHMGILMITVCGNIIPAILGYVACLFYGHVLIGNAFTTWAENYFRTYYRIPLFEKLDVILAPVSLAEQLTGAGLFDKRDVFEYVPSGLYIAAVFGWGAIVFLLLAIARKRRKVEKVGKIFVLPSAERTAEFLLSFLAGVWSGSFVMDLSGVALEHPAVGAAVSVLAGIAVAVGVHFLMEWGVGSRIRNISKARNPWQGGQQNESQSRLSEADADQDHAAHKMTARFRRNFQLIGECAAVALVCIVFFAGASAFDSYFPEEGNVEYISVSVDGLGMSYESYIHICRTGERYDTNQQLEKYVLAEDGKNAAQAWIHSLIEKSHFSAADTKEDTVETEQSSSAFTHAAICYHMKNGSEVYRLYPIDAEDFQAFSFVYETDEYKQIAWPAAEGKDIVDARFIWSDGITDTALKLTGEEKESIVDAYRNDVADLKMENLTEALPLGFVDIDSEMRLLSGEMPVYPFFKQTCNLLEKYGIPLNITLADYTVRSVSVKPAVSIDSPLNYAGTFSSTMYEEPEEIEKWIQKAVPERLDLQPLLYPLDYTQEIRAEVTDEMTNSITNVYCYKEVNRP